MHLVEIAFGRRALIVRPSGRGQVSAQNAKVHRRNQKWRESRRTASESQEWRYLWWTLKPPSAAHAAIPCSSAENAQHRRLAGGEGGIRTDRRLWSRARRNS